MNKSNKLNQTQKDLIKLRHKADMMYNDCLEAEPYFAIITGIDKALALCGVELTYEGKYRVTFEKWQDDQDLNTRYADVIMYNGKEINYKELRILYELEMESNPYVNYDK